MALRDAVPFTDLLIRVGAPRPNSDKAAVEAVVDRDSLFYGGTLDVQKYERFGLGSHSVARRLNHRLIQTHRTNLKAATPNGGS